MILEEIIKRKRKDIDEMKRRFPAHRLRDAVKSAKRSNIRSFKKAIKSSNKLNLICEIKKASPSQGVIREDFQPLRIASEYEAGGAAALSVLTETHYFKGRPSYLRTIRQVTSIPIFRKDFIFETYQLYESALLEADAFLLIASILTHEEIKVLIELGQELGMDALVEVHTTEDLQKAVEAGAEIIGINNRNLKTLEVDTQMAKKIIPQVPKGKIVVVESGIKTHDEIMEYKSLGISSFLVGTSLMKSNNLVRAVQTLLGKDQKWKKGIT